jgi:hypothetical protein
MTTTAKGTIEGHIRRQEAGADGVVQHVTVHGTHRGSTLVEQRKGGR